MTILILYSLNTHVGTSMLQIKYQFFPYFIGQYHVASKEGMAQGTELISA